MRCTFWLCPICALFPLFLGDFALTIWPGNLRNYLVSDMSNPIFFTSAPTKISGGNIWLSVQDSQINVLGLESGWYRVKQYNLAGLALEGTQKVQLMTTNDCYQNPVQGVESYDGYTFVAAGVEGLKIYDLSNPEGLVHSGIRIGDTQGIKVSNGYAYFADSVVGLGVVKLFE